MTNEQITVLQQLLEDTEREVDAKLAIAKANLSEMAESRREMVEALDSVRLLRDRASTYRSALSDAGVSLGLSRSVQSSELIQLDKRLREFGRAFDRELVVK